MIRRKYIWPVLCVFAAILGSSPLAAHPHVWVTMSTEIMRKPDPAYFSKPADQKRGQEGVIARVTWVFDDAYSAYSVIDMKKGTDGLPLQSALDQFGQEVLTNLKKVDYYTALRYNITNQADEWADITERYVPTLKVFYKNDRLKMVFDVLMTEKTSDFAAELSQNQWQAELRIFDPSYFISMEYRAEDAVTFSPDLARICQADVSYPSDSMQEQMLIEMAKNPVNYEYDGEDNQNIGMGALYAPIAKIQCQPIGRGPIGRGPTG